jgi:hypothetical protein
LGTFSTTIFKVIVAEAALEEDFGNSRFACLTQTSDAILQRKVSSVADASYDTELPHSLPNLL